MQYLKILQDRYGNIEVKIKTTHETTGEKDFYIQMSINLNMIKTINV